MKEFNAENILKVLTIDEFEFLNDILHDIEEFMEFDESDEDYYILQNLKEFFSYDNSFKLRGEI